MTKLRLREGTFPRSQSKKEEETGLQSRLSGSKYAGSRVGTPECHLAAPQPSQRASNPIGGYRWWHPSSHTNVAPATNRSLRTPHPHPQTRVFTVNTYSPGPKDRPIPAQHLPLITCLQARAAKDEGSTDQGEKKNFKSLNHNLK